MWPQLETLQVDLLKAKYIFSFIDAAEQYANNTP